MKPTSEQVQRWFDEWVESDTSDSWEHVAQRAAELASAQSAERIAELERQRGKLLEMLEALVVDDMPIDGMYWDYCINKARAAIAELREAA